MAVDFKFVIVYWIISISIFILLGLPKEEVTSSILVALIPSFVGGYILYQYYYQKIIRIGLFVASTNDSDANLRRFAKYLGYGFLSFPIVMTIIEINK